MLSRISAGFCAQLSAGGVTGVLPGCRGPMGGWESHSQTLIAQDQLRPGELCYDHFTRGADIDGRGTTMPIFILDFPLSLHNTFFSGKQ